MFTFWLLSFLAFVPGAQVDESLREGGVDGNANGRRCDNCGCQPALRRYCRACSPKASALYKRNERREAKAAGEHYWVEWWEKTYGEAADAKRCEYQRLYMRTYRRRQWQRRP